MKFVYDGPGARTFRGYFFWNRNPVEVTDRATLAAIEREPEFRRIDEERQDALQDATKEEKVNGCPKCGRALPTRGAHNHIRFCRG